VRILVAGIGNIFFGDDGFGVAVAGRLAAADLPEGVRLGEYGIRGLHLAYELLDGYDVLVLVDALPMGEAPGTVAILEVDPTDFEPDPTSPMDAHSMSPATVLGLLAGLGGRLDRVLVVGCDPAILDEGIGLSAVVETAVAAAADATRELLSELCSRTKVSHETRS
jgi:hydrogenase maturation protease